MRPEPTVSHVIATIRKVADAHEAHDAAARQSVILIHRETLAQAIDRAKGQTGRDTPK